MRKRIKRWAKRLFKIGGVFFLIGMIFVFGVAIGSESTRSRHTVIVRPDSAELEQVIEQRVEQQIVERIERIEERVAVPPIPTIPPIPTVPPIPEIPEMPPMPEMPEMPPMPEFPEMPQTIYIERLPSFFEVVNGVGTVLASLGLIGLGIVMIIRGRRGPKEKSPETLNN